MWEDSNTKILQLKDFKAGQREEPCIKITQENLMEFLVQSIYLIYYTR